MKHTALAPLLLSLFTLTAGADVRLPALVGDHMVLQQNDTVNVWGWADPGEVVTLSGTWSTLAQVTTADETGLWSAKVKTGPAGGPHQILIRANNDVVVDDVMLGEVWVCGGQSNMEWSMDACAPNYIEEKAAANHPEIRLFYVQKTISPTPLTDCIGSWKACTPETARSFSAIGYFFGKELHETLDVPIGLINCNWGGTVAEAWMSEGALRDWPAFEAGLEFVRECAADPEGREAKLAERLAAWWEELAQRDKGTREGWQAAELDDSGWESLDVPSNWNGTPLSTFDGIVWMRKRFTAPADWAGKACVLELGPIDDMDTTWVNGVRVGGMENTGAWNEPRTYEVPAGVIKAGENVVAVRVYDSGGGGGLHGKAEGIGITPRNQSRLMSLAGAWRYAASTAQGALPAWPTAGMVHPNYPTALYNGMLAPIQRYGIRGAIWYQGESNLGRNEQYRSLFPAMIADWRKSFGRPEFPFYFVQIAPYNYGNVGEAAGRLREAQREALAVPNTGMAVTMDIGNPADIHPKNKLDVGHRLALWARAKTYGDESVTVWSGPLFRSAEREGAALRLSFDSVGEGLRTRDGEAPSHFTVAGADRVFHAATATLDGATLLVSSPEVPEPVAVRYAFGTADEPNLENSAGLPSPSFRSDNW